jgi:hypothetical protein
MSARKPSSGGYAPFLGTTTDSSRAFPGITEVDLTVSQDPYCEYVRNAWQRTNVYTKETVPRFERCLNPKCQQGGLDLQQIVLSQQEGEHSFHCKGHEGTPAGRRKGDPCDNVFRVRLAVGRK